MARPVPWGQVAEDTVRKTTALVGALVLLAASPAGATPSLDDYRHFRALAIDLEGRIPTPTELAAFEQAGFDLDAWIDQKLAEPGYADRVARIYMDALRLQVNPVFRDGTPVVGLRRATLIGPDGSPVTVFYRLGQRRARPETDGDFCMTPSETGYQFPAEAAPIPYPAGAASGTPVAQSVLDANTVVVKPWWLYKDYKSAAPSQRYDKTWAATYGLSLVQALTVEPDGKTPTMQVRVCKEEAQTADTGHVFVTGRAAPPPGTPPPGGRLIAQPFDDAFTKQHGGEAISCRSQTGFSHSAECGCGVGLEHCFPVAGSNPNNSPSAIATSLDVFGAEMPVDQSNQSFSDWNLLWWSEEARRFLAFLFGDDRDFREIVSAPYTFVNGPLAQYYRDTAPASCCGQGATLGYVQPKGLVDPSVLPADLPPLDARTWVKVPARSDAAAGILTMPVFLAKYGTRRSKAHVLYNAFLCKDFIAPPNLKLPPSTDPNLMTRPGCSTCHATLEPMAAYFSRIVESDVTFLPKESFPIDTAAACSVSGPQPPVCACKVDAKGKMSNACALYFDPAFSDAKHAVLRGAYPDVLGVAKGHVDAGPLGMADELAKSPEFSACVAKTVASSFLGRAVGPDDAALQQTLADALGQNGFRMRAVVRALLKSDAYRRANNLSSTAWRAAQGGSR